MNIIALISMSPEEAKRILGFPPGANPTEDEVRKAQRQQAVKHHPDTGGEAGKLVEVNNAADVLLNKHDYDRRPGDSGGYGGPPARGYGYNTDPAQTWKEPEPEVTTFDEAKAKAGVPSDVDWVFITDRQRGTSYSSDEFSRSEATWVAYGRSATQHVFVGMNHFAKSDYFVGGRARQDHWKIEVQSYPIRGDEGQQPAWLYGNVVKALKKAGFDGRFNSKVVDAKGWHFDAKFPHGAAMSLKHFLVETGAVSGDDARVQGRKHVIEAVYSKSYSPDTAQSKPDIHEVTYGTPPHTYVAYEGLSIVINGRPYALDQVDMQRVAKVKLRGRSLLNAIFGDTGQTKKNLTRMQTGKLILKWLSENLKSLPEAALQTLRAAAEQ
jgi:hypothetical protein